MRENILGKNNFIFIKNDHKKRDTVRIIDVRKE